MSIEQQNLTTKSNIETDELLFDAEMTSRSLPEVYIFEHSNFQGRYQRFEVGGQTSEPIAPELAYQVSSLIVPPEATVMLFDSQSGIQQTFTGRVSYVGDYINDRADGIEITQVCAPDAEVC